MFIKVVVGALIVPFPGSERGPQSTTIELYIRMSRTVAAAEL